jgi:hypothetical protein
MIVMVGFGVVGLVAALLIPRGTAQGAGAPA